jgi:malic enzyme
MRETRYLFVGAGSAGIGIADMCAEQMESEGLSKKEANARIYMVNSKGLVVPKT